MHTQVTDEHREFCAIRVMHTMLTNYCNEKGTPFEQTFFDFSTSTAYKMLFDYTTGLWKEGSDYLRNFFSDMPEPSHSASSPKIVMTEREIDIADMQCWVFRMAQHKWGITPAECSALFKKFDIFGYIVECYDLVCTYSYSHVVDDAEAMCAVHFIDCISVLIHRQGSIVHNSLCNCHRLLFHEGLEGRQLLFHHSINLFLQLTQGKEMLLNMARMMAENEALKMAI